MDYQRLLQGILDIGEAMLMSGAENFRIDDSLYRICKSYGFVKYDVFVIPRQHTCSMLCVGSATLLA